MEIELAKRYMRMFPAVTDLTIGPSNRINKRYRADFMMDGKWRIVHFGQLGAVTYLDRRDSRKKNAYQSRASKIRDKSGEVTYNKAGTANSFSYNLLW